MKPASAEAYYILIVAFWIAAAMWPPLFWLGAAWLLYYLTCAVIRLVRHRRLVPEALRKQGRLRVIDLDVLGPHLRFRGRRTRVIRGWIRKQPDRRVKRLWRYRVIWVVVDSWTNAFLEAWGSRGFGFPWERAEVLVPLPLKDDAKDADREPRDCPTPAMNASNPSREHGLIGDRGSEGYVVSTLHAAFYGADLACPCCLSSRRHWAGTYPTRCPECHHRYLVALSDDWTMRVVALRAYGGEPLPPAGTLAIVRFPRGDGKWGAPIRQEEKVVSLPIPLPLALELVAYEDPTWLPTLGGTPPPGSGTPTDISVPD